MIYERKHQIGLDEVDRRLDMTNDALIRLFQNTACFMSDEIGLGIRDIPVTLLTWFVIDWKVEVIQRPQYGDTMRVKTWGRDVYKCFSYRDFEVFVNDELYVKATSKWVLLDVKNQTYAEVTDELMERFGIDNSRSVFEQRELAHLQVLDHYDNKERIYIRKSDLDFNGHVNNVKYFDYLIDYGKGIDHDCFRITYRKEIREDDKVYLCHSQLGNRHHYAIVDEEGTVKTIMETYDHE